MRTIRLILLAFYFCTLLLPGISGYIVSQSGSEEKTVNPNESSQALPPLANMFNDDDFSAKYEQYFRLTHGMRQELGKAKRQLQYWLFSESEETIIGKDGWLFDKGAVEKVQNTCDTLPDASWGKLAQRLLRLNAVVEKTGAKLLIIPVPWKNTVLSDYLPDSYMRPNPNCFDKFMALLKANGLLFIDVRAILSLNPTAYYFKTDPHWTYIAASEIAKSIVHMCGEITKIESEWCHSYKISERRFIGAEAMAMGVFFPPIEEGQVINAPAPPVSPAPEPYGYYSRAEANMACKTPLLPKAVSVGNSFNMYFESSGLYRYFREIYRLYDVYFFKKNEWLIPEGTKLVLWQLQELQIGYQLQDDAWWEKIERMYENQKLDSESVPDYAPLFLPGNDGWVKPIAPLGER